jgi:hypothetical protein
MRFPSGILPPSDDRLTRRLEGLSRLTATAEREAKANDPPEWLPMTKASCNTWSTHLPACPRAEAPRPVARRHSNCNENNRIATPVRRWQQPLPSRALSGSCISTTRLTAPSPIKAAQAPAEAARQTDRAAGRHGKEDECSEPKGSTQPRQQKLVSFIEQAERSIGATDAISCYGTREGPRRQRASRTTTRHRLITTLLFFAYAAIVDNANA